MELPSSLGKTATHERDRARLENALRRAADGLALVEAHDRLHGYPTESEWESLVKRTQIAAADVLLILKGQPLTR